MPKIYLLLIALFLSCITATSQTLDDIFTNVDTLYMPGAAPGHLAPISQDVTPIVSSSPCNSSKLNYSVATQYQNGRVLAIGHESLLVNSSIGSADNLAFLTNAIAWLSPGSRISLKEGWVNNGNTSSLQTALTSNNYTFGVLSGDITTASLANTDILILGNDWNGTQAYTAAELSAVDNFVANGGGILIAGLGWSWPQALSIYPMNAVANLFGFEFTTDVINDPDVNINGSPLLYHFYPENQDTSFTPYCPSPYFGKNFARGENLRVLRLAVSATGEFTQQSGGVNATTALIDEWLEEINDIYGREYSVRFELIPNNNQLIFDNPATDPWGTLPAGSGGCTNAGIILNRQATVVDSVIGSANYDISHIIAGSPFGGGCAGGFKSGVSGGLNIPVTRHEIGHQFSQSHTINHSDNRNYEPENGAWTIQGGNAQSHGHGVSFHQLADFLANTVPNTGNQVPTGNTVPTVDAGPDVAIPISTPFTLTGMATDPDAGDSLTYVWDNMSRGLPQTIPVADDAQGAIFMRLLPDTSSSRTFPTMSDVVANNNSNAQEQLPSQARIMDIRLTVNDNHKIMYQGEMVNASGSDSDDIRITVAEAGPFVVTSQNSAGISYPGGSSQLVSWAVNGTDTLPINTQQVSISLSTDGGFSYPIVLLASTPNTGSATVTIPTNLATTSARIKVSAVDNIYFDINTQDFEIEFVASTSIEAAEGFPLSIYPNPSTGIFIIEVPAQLRFQASVYDVRGILLLEQSNESEVDMSDFAEGLYLIEVIDLDSHQKVTRKLMKVE